MSVPGNGYRLSELRRLIDENAIVTYFQPVIHLQTGMVIGHEALNRGPEGSCFDRADALFSFAESAGLLCDLEKVCQLNSLKRARERTLEGKLFVNCSLHGLLRPKLGVGQLSQIVTCLGLRQENVVIEIAAHVPDETWLAVKVRLAMFRRHGFMISIDHAGAGYDSLMAMAEIEPDFVKIDVWRIRARYQRQGMDRLLEPLVRLCRRTHAAVIAEGIEDRDELETLAEMGLELGQGFYFGKPAKAFQPEYLVSWQTAAE